MNMEYCPIASRMEAACPILKPGKLIYDFSNLEAEMDEIARLLVKCCNDYIVNGYAEGLKYMSEIYSVKTFLPDPESYRNLIETNCTNPFYEPASPEFYEFEIVKVVDRTIAFKSLFSLEMNEESVEKFVVLQVGQRAALILVSLARIALLQSRFYTALACCRVGLILVRLLNSISSRTLWISHQVLFFLLAAEAVEACAFLAAFDHISCCQCAKIMDKAVLRYQGFLNIFRSYGAQLTKTEEDLMLSVGESLADVGAICGKLEVELQLNELIGYHIQFQLSIAYFHLSVKEVTVYRSGSQLSVPPNNPRDFYLELCVRGFEELFDPYMAAAALFCRGCFHSASVHNAPNRRKIKKLMEAERDFLCVLDMAKNDQLLLSSIPWKRLIEKAYLASLVTQCRILVRCATSSDVEHLRSGLNHLYTLVKWRSSSKPNWGSPACRQFSALACLAFMYLTDHIRGAADVFADSEKSSLSLRRAKCVSLAFRLLKDEATLSFCLKVFCDLSKERLDGDEFSTDWESLLHRSVHRLQLLSMPIFAADNSLFSLAETNNARTTVAVSSNDMGIVPFSHFKQNGLKPPEPCLDTGELGDADSLSSSSGAIQCLGSTSKRQRILEKDNSPKKLVDELLTSENDFFNESFTAVNSQIDMFSLKIENHALTDAVESSNYQSHLNKKNHYRSMKLPSNINRTSLNADIDSRQKDITLLHPTYNGLVSHSKTDQYVKIDETFRSVSSWQKENRQSFKGKTDSVIDAASRVNLMNFSKSLQYDLATNRPRTRRLAQFQNSTRYNYTEYVGTNFSSAEQNRVVAKTITHGSQKRGNESLKFDLGACPDLSECSRSIVDTPKISDLMESSNTIAPVARVALEHIEISQLDGWFDSLLHRNPVSPKVNVFPNPSMVGGTTCTAIEGWVALFPLNSSSPKESEKTSFIESLPAASQEVKPSCAKPLSESVQESSTALRGKLFTRENGNLAHALAEHPDSQDVEKLAQESVDESKVKRVSRELPDDTDDWLVFLRRSSLLRTVEDNLEELFFIDGTDDLRSMKNIITNDLRSLCCSIAANRGNPCPDYLKAHADRAYTTALRPLKRDSGVAEFYSLLTTLFDALDANPFGSAALWT